MTTPIDQIINYANLYQDVELASAISALKNAGQVTSFIQNQQSKVYNDIIKQKEGTFAKVYGDLSRASKVQEAVLLYDKRTKQLADVQNQIYDNQKNSADAIINDESMANRKTEMNEWSVNNKKDTLFIYSSLFILLASLLLLTGLLRMGLISSSLWVGIAVCLVVVFALIFANRYYYTTVLRNKRFWNKQIFEGKYGKIPVPLCPNVEQAIADMPATATNLQKQVQSGIANNLINVTQSLASGTQSMANQVKHDMSAYQTR
jgi:hypothetical protein